MSDRFDESLLTSPLRDDERPRKTVNVRLVAALIPSKLEELQDAVTAGSYG